MISKEMQQKEEGNKMREKRVSPAHGRKGGKGENNIDTYFLTSMAGSVLIIFRLICSDFFCICVSASVFVAALEVVFTKSLLVSLCGLQHMLLNSMEASCSRELQMLFCVTYQEKMLGRLSLLFVGNEERNYNRSLCCNKLPRISKCRQELCSGVL